MEQRKKADTNFIQICKNVLSRVNICTVSLIVLIIYAVVAALLCIFLFKANAIAICAMVVLEALLATCLSRIPLWIHGVVFAAQIVAGIFASKIVMMILIAVIYLISIIFLNIWINYGKNKLSK